MKTGCILFEVEKAESKKEVGPKEGNVAQRLNYKKRNRWIEQRELRLDQRKETIEQCVLTGGRKKERGMSMRIVNDRSIFRLEYSSFYSHLSMR